MTEFMDAALALRWHILFLVGVSLLTFVTDRHTIETEGRVGR